MARLTRVDVARLLRDIGAHAGEGIPFELGEGVVATLDITRYLSPDDNPALAVLPALPVSPFGLPLDATGSVIGQTNQVFVTQGEVWLVQAVHGRIVTSAVVGNRLLQLTISKDLVAPPTLANEIFNQQHDSNIAGGSTLEFNIGNTTKFTAGGLVTFAWGHNWPLMKGGELAVYLSLSGVQAGDVIDNVTVRGQRWKIPS